MLTRLIRATVLAAAAAVALLGSDAAAGTGKRRAGRRRPVWRRPMRPVILAVLRGNRGIGPDQRDHGD